VILPNGKSKGNGMIWLRVNATKNPHVSGQAQIISASGETDDQAAFGGINGLAASRLEGVALGA
jgi:hypothetical protein